MYKKSGNYNTIDEYIKAKTGKTIRGLNRFKSSYVIKNLDLVAERLKRAAREKQLVYVYGDYDTDGITSVTEMAILLSAIGAMFNIYCPRRFSDGYGINVNTIDNVPDGALLVTIDNGIAAIEALEKAYSRGIEVIILDHHMARVDENGTVVLPKASIIVDPEAFPEGSDFDGYCGAGIACELAKLMLTPGSMHLEYIKSLAAIGTVADVVPLISANRKIVKEGLENINSGIMPVGLDVLQEKIRHVSKINGPILSEHLGYYISPCFNAAGRLVDTGAMGVAATILENEPVRASQYASQLINWNIERKNITKDAIEHVVVDEDDNINFILSTAHAGCVGLVASDLVKLNNRPSFVGTDNGRGLIVGSGRSNDPSNNIKDMLDSVAPLLVKYGGHAEAAGFSFKKENFDEIHRILSNFPVKEICAEPTYDLDITDPLYIPSILNELDSVEPFGKGVEKPIFRLKVKLEKQPIITRDEKHLRFEIGNMSAMAFNMAERYKKENIILDEVYLYGDLKWNYFKDRITPQMIIKDYEVA